MYRVFLKRVAMVCLFITGIPSLRLWYMRRKKPVIRILTYHAVTSSELFRKHLMFLDQKFNLISPQDVKEGALERGNINVVLSFDDGYKGWSECVFPVLEEFGIGAYFFVSSGFVLTEGDEEAEALFSKERLLVSPKKPLAVTDVQYIANHERHVLGGHTVHHPNLAMVDTETLETEIVEDKLQLEKWTASRVACFAYPFGVPGLHVTDRVVLATQRAGYSEAFTTEITFSDYTDSYRIARVCTEYTDPNWFTYLSVIGVYDLIKRATNRML